MGTSKPKMAASLRAIRSVLLQDWDPIAVRGLPEAQDEYDSYAMPLYTILRQHPSVDSLVDHLYHLETEHMGLIRIGRHHLRPVAEKLLGIDVSADEMLQ
jgi:hypothetical protein